MRIQNHNHGSKKDFKLVIEKKKCILHVFKHIYINMLFFNISTISCKMSMHSSSMSIHKTAFKNEQIKKQIVYIVVKNLMLCQSYFCAFLIIIFFPD